MNEGTYTRSTVATASNGANIAKATSHNPARRPQAPRLEGSQGWRSDCVMARYLSTDIAVMVNTLEATATPAKNHKFSKSYVKLLISCYTKLKHLGIVSMEIEDKNLYKLVSKIIFETCPIIIITKCLK